MQTRKIACLGLNHRSAPLELRERLALDLDEVRRNWRQSADSPIQELVVLSTCNRVELYAVFTSRGDEARAVLAAMLEEASGFSIDDISEHLYYATGLEAVEHICRVASGLDSLVLGEQQILGQVNEAYRTAFNGATRTSLLASIFRAAIRAGKRARAETEISTNPVSMSSIAISYAQERLGKLRDRRVLVVGLGEMGLLTLKALRARNIDNVAIVNRSPARTRAVADEYGYRTYPLDSLVSALADADVVISVTSAPETIISAGMVNEAMASRNGHDLVLIDIAVPRDVDPCVRDIPGVYLFDVDDMRGTLDRALRARQRQIPRVERIIEDEIAALRDELGLLTVRPLIVDLRQKAESIRRRELERTLKHLREADPEVVEHIHHLSRAIVNKLLHEPTTRIKRARDDERTDYESTVRDLFGLRDRKGSLT